MNGITKVGKALADATRVRILSALRGGELCVCELADALKLTQSTLSTHLQQIRSAGLVDTRRSGKWVYYTLQPKAAALLEAVFRHSEDDGAGESVLARDQAQLANRLQQRKDGACCIGFCSGQSGKKKKP